MKKRLGFIALCLLFIPVPETFATTATAQQKIDEITPRIEEINCLNSRPLLNRFREIKRLVDDMHKLAVKFSENQPDVESDFENIQTGMTAFEAARTLFDAAFIGLTEAIRPFEEQFNRDGRLIYADDEAVIEIEAQRIIAALDSLKLALVALQSASQNMASYWFSRKTVEIYPVWRNTLDPSTRAQNNVLMFLEPVLADVNRILNDQQLKLTTPLLWLEARQVHFDLFDFQVMTLIARFYSQELLDGVEWLKDYVRDQQGDLSEDADNLAIEAETIFASVQEKCRYRIFSRDARSVDPNVLKRFLENGGIPRGVRSE